MDEQMITNPWLPEFLQNAPQYALWLEVLQYLLLIVLAIALFTMTCALLDLILLLRQERQNTQPLSVSLMKSLTRWLDTHITQLPLWRALTAGMHTVSQAREQARHLRFPH